MCDVVKVGADSWEITSLSVLSSISMIGAFRSSKLDHYDLRRFIDNVCFLRGVRKLWPKVGLSDLSRQLRLDLPKSAIRIEGPSQLEVSVCVSNLYQ
jgi:hypothetical protein